VKILAADVGGTNTRLGYYEWSHEGLQLLAREKFGSQEHESLAEIVREFISSQTRSVESACFGVAGPVQDGRSEMPNLGWKIDAQVLARTLGLTSVGVINDLEANAYGLTRLEPTDLLLLQDGSPDAKGNQALLSAGTGLGEAGLYWDGTQYRPFATEGGHADFAPRNELEAELLLYLKREFDHVSYERVLSGNGLHNIYRFLRDTGRGQEQTWVRDELRRGDAAAILSRVALEGKDPLSAEALYIFVSLYGAEAGNLALRLKATGGVYLGGGIAPKIATKLRSQTFVDSFVKKGRLASLLETIPVSIILNEDTALLGAAHVAAQLPFFSQDSAKKERRPA
jgi:glucokinase